jgi:hypothetical protein
MGSETRRGETPPPGKQADVLQASRERLQARLVREQVGGDEGRRPR